MRVVARDDVGHDLLKSALKRQLSVEVERLLDTGRADQIALQDGDVTHFGVSANGESGTPGEGEADGLAAADMHQGDGRAGRRLVRLGQYPVVLHAAALEHLTM